MKNNFFKRLLSILILGPLVLLSIYFGMYFFFALMMFLLVAGLYEISKLKNYTDKTLLLIIFIAFIFSILNLRFYDNGLIYVSYIVFVTWLSDTGGYIFGKIIGGKKINFISPNKTYSGFAGSIVLSQFAYTVFMYNNFLNINHILLIFTFIIFSSIVVIIGDLFFSWIKRKNDIKNYSKLIPGHGGLLDRIDGLIFLTIFLQIFIYFL